MPKALPRQQELRAEEREHFVPHSWEKLVLASRLTHALAIQKGYEDTLKGDKARESNAAVPWALLVLYLTQISPAVRRQQALIAQECGA